MIGKCCFVLVFWSLMSVSPDEGQWLPQQFLELDWNALKARGLELTRDEFWHPEKGGVLSAAVQINGCSASLISEEGLVITNHHCAFGAIQRASTVENNYVDNGFLAATRAEEIPAQGVQLRVVRKIEDVTKKVHAAEAKAQSPLEKMQAVQAEVDRLEKEGEASASNTECQVSSYLEGRIYTMAYRTLIQDVRLVYAPPRSVGEFGGEIDNWEWPRHTGDFTFLRAYVGPDGKPAGYSKDNVPLKPEHYLKVPGKGLEEGDLVMILGYPGRTSRYLSSVAVQAREKQLYPLRERYFTKLIELLNARAGDDPELKLRFSSNIKSFANVEKNAQGMVWGLKRNQVVAGKQREEAEFAEWVGTHEEEAKGFQNILRDVLATDAEEAATLARDTIMLRFFGNARVLSALMDVGDILKDDPSEEQRRRLASQIGSDRVTSNASWLDIPLTEFLLHELRRLPESQQIPGLSDLMGTMSSAEFTKQAYEHSAYMKGQARGELLTSETALSDSDPDLLLRLARLLGGVRAEARQKSQNLAARRHVQGRTWIAGQQKWRGKSFYPDANSTLRVSVATVKGYEPRDGIRHVPFTTVSGILEKETGAEPFKSPEALHKAAANSKSSRFCDKTVGDVPVCFLADGDTTGGNSGSGVINGRGELVGLNFDRVFENVAGDFGWNPDRSRNICVDIRYVLWHLEQVNPAPHILKELGL